MRYSFDTSAFIYAWNVAYRPEIFPSVWDRIDQLICDGVLIASDEVREELTKKQDELSKWVRNATGLFVKTRSDIQKEVSRLLKTFPNMIHTDAAHPETDAFVIAVAIVEDCTVVSQERFGSAESPKIPFICKHFGIRCLKLFDFVAEQDWSI